MHYASTVALRTARNKWEGRSNRYVIFFKYMFFSPKNTLTACTFELQRLWSHQGQRRQERMSDSVPVPFCRLLPIWRNELVFCDLHVHVRINEPGLAIYYCALWAVPWEPNLVSRLLHLLIGHWVPFLRVSACSALPWPCRGQPGSL